MSAALLPIASLAALLSVDAWIYLDARTQERQGTPVVCSLGAFVVDTPGSWFICCVFLSVVFVPLYLLGRAR